MSIVTFPRPSRQSTPAPNDDFHLSDDDIAFALDHPGILPRVCAHCRMLFQPHSAGHRYCSELCRIRARNARQHAAGTLIFPTCGERRRSTIIADLKYQASHDGEPLPADWVGHHRNGDTRDYRMENIEPLSSPDHMRLHAADRRNGDALAARMHRHRRGAVGVRAKVTPSFRVEAVPSAEIENETGSFNARRDGNAAVLSCRTA